MNEAYEPNVFITNFKGQDLNNARTFGRLKAISNERIIETFRLDQLSRRVTEALAKSNPEDWIITTGHMVLGILTCIEFLRLHKRLNLLIYHAREKKYLPRILKVRPNEEAGEPVLEEIIHSEVPIELA